MNYNFAKNYHLYCLIHVLSTREITRVLEFEKNIFYYQLITLKDDAQKIHSYLMNLQRHE